MADDTAPIETSASGRECGDCTLCCKVMGIGALEKPRGRWCPHCQPGQGCTIYASRPTECRTFYCSYMATTAVGEHWRPVRSKIVLVRDQKGNRITAHVDPKYPGAWRRDPFYGDLRRWAAAAAGRRGQVLVMVGDRATAILPDADVELGVITSDDRIVIVEHTQSDGTRSLDALKLRHDDPRLQGARQGVAQGDFSTGDRGVGR